MSRNTAETQEKLATDIRRQFGDRSLTRFLGAMPTYKVVSDLPHHMKELLDRLVDLALERHERRRSLAY